MAADEADVVEKVAERFGDSSCDHELDSVLVLVQEDSVHHHVTVYARPVASRPLV
jgi:hypothetical protein